MMATNPRIKLDQALWRRSSAFHFKYGVENVKRDRHRDVAKGAPWLLRMGAVAAEYLHGHLGEHRVGRRPKSTMFHPLDARVVAEGLQEYRSCARRAAWRANLATVFVNAVEDAPGGRLRLENGSVWSRDYSGRSSVRSA